MGKLASENDCLSLPVAEEFYSVQGEGCNTGRAAYFIRLAGCDVRCSFCDSKATWNVNHYKNLSPVAEIAARAAASQCRNVVITGGEPLMHNLDALCAALKEHGLSIWLETSGAHPLSGSFDWICVSPKNQKPPLDEVLQKADELKAVIADADDFAFAEQCAKKTRQGCSLMLQAEWDSREAAYPLIFNYVLKNPAWRISIQTHKILNIR
ncbi:MAG: 7-carboxy-7-deazaguanine synthase QueE [Bacteroidales bacterium]|nr:7-carboxy-7-deazaguanine synthase QueE [Bacteroidales bacterium]